MNFDKMEHSVYIDILEYGVNHPKGFYEREIFNNVGENDIEKDIVSQLIWNAKSNKFRLFAGQLPSLDTPFTIIKYNSTSQIDFPDATYILTFDAQIKYLDYFKLQEARKSSKQASIYAITAIVISIITMIIQIIVK